MPRRLRRSSHSSWNCAVVVTSVLVVTVGCTKESAEMSTTTTSTMNVQESITADGQPAHSANGVLKIGLLIPTSDPAAPFGPELVGIVNSAIKIINAIQGPGGERVQLVVVNESSNVDTARQIANRMIDAGDVDAVIGPFSALTAPTVVPLLTRAGIGVCSPSVSSMFMSGFNGDGLFFRTSTQDAEIVSRMAQFAERSGSGSVSVAYPDDLYGRQLAQLLTSRLEELDLTVDSIVSYSTSPSDPTPAATEIAEDAAPVDLIITNRSSGGSFLNSYLAVAKDSIAVLNETFLESPPQFPTGQESGSRPQIFSFSPDPFVKGLDLRNLIVLDPELAKVTPATMPAYSVPAIDCLMLFWLSSLIRNSDDAREFTKEVLDVANKGQSCYWIPDCKDDAESRINFDYEGVASLALDDSGAAIDPSLIERTRLLLYEFDSDGVPQLIVGSPSIDLNL